jgi:hypothetical protein
MNELKAVPVLTCPAPRINHGAIPRHTQSNIARLVLDAVQRDFQRPEIKEDYERWLAQRERKENQ